MIFQCDVYNPWQVCIAVGWSTVHLAALDNQRVSESIAQFDLVWAAWCKVSVESGTISSGRKPNKPNTEEKINSSACLGLTGTLRRRKMGGLQCLGRVLTTCRAQTAGVCSKGSTKGTGNCQTATQPGDWIYHPCQLIWAAGKSCGTHFAVAQAELPPKGKKNALPKVTL